MAKTKDQRKGIFCLEGHWESVKDKTTVEPVLRLLETLSGYNASYRRYDVATREEFNFYLKKWCGASFNNYPILYLGFHGDKGEIFVGEGRASALSLEDLAERLAGRCKGRVVHFGSCGTVDVHGRKLTKFLNLTGALAVCGYTKEVDWLESAAFDVLVLGGLQNASFRQASSMRKFDAQLRTTASGLYKHLGFRMACLD
ncbi:MAG: hypothetical protein OXF27_15955 [Acidobacteria bacterium]|nr:hypothetical protein [Acidobacteriota bacterium]